MKLLQELVNPNTVSLTNTQQAVLVIIKISATPEVAFENTSGSEQSVYSRNLLRSLGLIKIGGNKTVLTQAGQNVLLNYNLVDNTGQLTDRGTQAIQNYKNQFNTDKVDNDVNAQQTDMNQPDMGQS